MGKDAAHIADAASGTTCRRVVHELIERYGWTLLAQQDLVERVLSANCEMSPSEARRQAEREYAIALYEACRQAGDPSLRNTGYRELHHILYRAAHNRWPELAEDATQQALLLVYEQIDRCRDPGAFVAFALFKLRHAFKRERRARGQEEYLEERIQDDVPADQATLAARLEQQDRCRALVATIQRLADERQRQVIVLKFLGGLSDEEIGKRLGITAGHVRVLRHRGIRRLQKDESLVEHLAGAR